MGLSETIQKAATTAFKAIGNIPLVSTYTSKGTPVYNPTTGAYTSTDTDYTGLKILFEDFTAREITEAGGAILSTDQKARIPNLSLTPTPKITDYIITSENKQWTVQNIMLDPAKALWVFQTRLSASTFTYWGFEMAGYWDTEMTDLWTTDMSEAV